MLKLRADLKEYSNTQRAKISASFFKTGVGDYGEGDQFIGVSVPHTRLIAKKYKDLSFQNLHLLRRSKIHEERLLALLILVDQFESGEEKIKDAIYKFYLANTSYINNWDLVDLSADKIVGAYLKDKPKDILVKLAKSKNLWEKRIAIVSTFHFIKNGESKHTFQIAKILLNDKHDLIQKAVGWMLREVGKRCSEKSLTDFLDEHAIQMPRTMLRYAIERFPENQRQRYLKMTRNR